MSVLKIGSGDVIEGRIYMPNVGAWSADLVVDQEGAPAVGDAIQLSSDASAFMLKGTARYSGSFLGTARILAVGGAGGLATLATPRYFENPTIRDVLDAYLSDGGETRSSTSDSAALGTTIPAWASIAQEIGTGLSSLAQAATGALWRVLPDGSIFFGVDTNPDTPTYEYLVTDQFPNDNGIEIGAAGPLVLPGDTFEGGIVSYVEHVIDPARVRSRIYFQPPV